MWGFRRTVGLVIAIGGQWPQTGASAATTYTWRDPSGVRHYSNVPVTRQRAVAVEDADLPAAQESAPPASAAPTEDESGSAAAPPPGGAETDQFSSDASLRRQALERTYRAARRRLIHLEQSLAAFSRLRTQHAARGTNAADAVSEEERPLLAQKSTTERELGETQAAYGALAAEVTARLGGLPDWWVALR